MDILELAKDTSSSVKIIKVPADIEIRYPIYKDSIWSIKNCINAYANIVYNLYGSTKSNINLICSGGSGITIALLLKIELCKNYDFDFINEEGNICIIYIKKEHEVSHSFDGRRSSINDYDINIFVDDFISEGYTIRYVMEGIEKRISHFDLVLAPGYLDSKKVIKYGIKDIKADYVIHNYE